jgi:serine/threonine protein kinase
MKRGRLTEREASLIVRDIANGLNFLHSKGMSHRYIRKRKKDWKNIIYCIYFIEI